MSHAVTLSAKKEGSRHFSWPMQGFFAALRMTGCKQVVTARFYCRRLVVKSNKGPGTSVPSERDTRLDESRRVPGGCPTLALGEAVRRNEARRLQSWNIRNE